MRLAQVAGAQGSMKLPDHQIEDWVFDCVVLHLRSASKAALIGIMTLFSMAVLTETIGKALIVSSICFAISLFNTWRRYLEPISFIVFCGAVVYWGAPELWQYAKMAAIAGVHVNN
jgi:hypothetical protein